MFAARVYTGAAAQAGTAMHTLDSSLSSGLAYATVGRF